MNVLNIEIKSSIEDADKIDSILLENGARFIGEDNQVDTYFNIESGRLKLRQGNIENALIHYFRPESKSLKRSVVLLQQLPPENNSMHRTLSLLHGVDVVVKKSRKIYFIDNVKFHVDVVDGLGNFVEIEAADKEGKYSESYLRKQCELYIELLGLDRNNFIDASYSDLVREMTLNTEKSKELVEETN